MNREEFLKQLIEKKYGNVRAFSREADIPYTTVRSILERGVGKASVDIVIRMCKYLGISAEQISEDFTFNKEITGTLTNLIQLVPERQLSVFEYSNKQLDDQQSKVTPIHNINEQSDAEPYTLAAHSSDPSKSYTEEEKKNIRSVLAEARKEYEEKNK